MAGGVHERVERVADGSGQKNREPRQTGAEQLRHEQADEHAEYQIAHQVAEFDMQREGGDGSPPFAADDAAGVRGAGRQPVDRQRVTALNREEEEQDGDVAERTFEPIQPWPPPARVLALIASEFVARPPSLGRGHAEPDHAGVREHMGLDADRREHEGTLLGIGARAKSANLDKSRHGSSAI